MMRRRRRNSAGGITDKASSWRRANSERDYADIYKRWHWGTTHDQIKNWDDPDLPNNPLIEVGRLWELHVRLPGGHDKVIEVNDSHKNKSYVAFDPHHKDQRLYLLLPPSVQKAAKRTFWDASKQRVQSLPQLAQSVHGSKARHAKGGYPNVQVKLVGALTDVVYRTHKKGDDDHQRGSSYIHALGEESKMLPALAVDAQGRLWIASGHYQAPTPGITD
jgi:hypothetical protein